MSAIYGLYDKDGQLRYIGKANDPLRRLSSHMRDSKRRDTPLYRWIRKHGQPEIRILIEASTDWRADEIRLIHEARSRGERLLNLAAGGDEPLCSAETRSKNGHKLVAKIRSDARFRRIWHAKRYLSVGLREGLVSNETRAKMRSAAQRHPDIFGNWLHLPDRIESGSNG